jgi:hypothetical protein
LPAAGPWREMFATEPPFRETWCTYTSQMTGIDSLLYKAGERDVGDGTDSEEEGGQVWNARMEARWRFEGYQFSKGRQKMRRRYEGGFTLGAMVDAVREMFERDEKAEWVVLESVRGNDTYVTFDS